MNFSATSKSSTLFGSTRSEGLGVLFYKTLHDTMEKMHQVDSTNGKTETSGSVKEKAVSVAIKLRMMNLTPDDIIVICLRPNPEQATILLAIFLIGAIVSPIDPEMTMTEMRETLLKLRPKLIFCDTRNVAHLEKSMSGIKMSKHVQIIHVGGELSGKISLGEILVSSDQVATFEPFVIHEPKKKTALIIATQGTTGKPKLVCHSDQALRNQLFLLKDHVFRKTDRLLTYFPINWIVQFLICCLCYITPMVRVLPSTFSERSAVKLVHDYKIDTLLISTNTCLKIVKHDSISDFNLTCLKHVMIGCDTTNPIHITTIEKRIPSARVSQLFVLTEICGILACIGVDGKESIMSNPASVGRCLPGMKIKVVDVHSKQPVPVNTWGELYVGGSSLMQGYLKEREFDETTIKGYVKTGDLAEYDSEGYIYVLGKVTDLVERDGITFTLTEIEETLLENPWVAEVAVVANSKDILACIIKVEESKLTVNNIKDYCNINLPLHMRPTKIKIITEFPKTTCIGKTKKKILEDNMLRVSVQRIGSISI